MAYTLGNKCTKNCCKWTILVQLISKMWSHVFLEHNVMYTRCASKQTVKVSTWLR